MTVDFNLGSFARTLPRLLKRWRRVTRVFQLVFCDDSKRGLTRWQNQRGPNRSPTTPKAIRMSEQRAFYTGPELRPHLPTDVEALYVRSHRDI